MAYEFTKLQLKQPLLMQNFAPRNFNYLCSPTFQYVKENPRIKKS